MLLWSHDVTKEKTAYGVLFLILKNLKIEGLKD